jgi:hypothetical protein
VARVVGKHACPSGHPEIGENKSHWTSIAGAAASGHPIAVYVE